MSNVFKTYKPSSTCPHPLPPRTAIRNIPRRWPSQTERALHSARIKVPEPSDAPNPGSQSPVPDPAPDGRPGRGPHRSRSGQKRWRYSGRQSSSLTSGGGWAMALGTDPRRRGQQGPAADQSPGGHHQDRRRSRRVTSEHPESGKPRSRPSPPPLPQAPSLLPGRPARRCLLALRRAPARHCGPSLRPGPPPPSPLALPKAASQLFPGHLAALWPHGLLRMGGGWSVPGPRQAPAQCCRRISVAEAR